MSVYIEKAFRQLYPQRQYNYSASLNYSGRFSDYNANMKLQGFTSLEVNLSKKWRGVNEDILIGLIQSLLLKIFGGKKAADQSTVNIELYNLFIKNLHLSIPKDNVDSHLATRFKHINAQFFDAQLEIPNLVWGQYSRRKLGSYDFQNDTITISKALANVDQTLLDYVLYHEMLHKHFKFTTSSCKNRFHSTEFKIAEKLFPNYQQIEHKLRYLPKKSRSKFTIGKLFTLLK